MTMFKIRDNLFVLSVKILIFSSLPTRCESARILGIMPTSAFSHQMVFQPLWKELSQRGHRVVVLTTHPMKDRSLTNLTEVDLDFVNALFDEVHFYEKFATTDNFFELGIHLRRVTIELTHKLLGSDVIQQFLRNNPSFDLVMAEAHFPSILGLIGYYKCPWIGVSSMEPAFQYHLAVGNQVHPVLNPDGNLDIEDVDDLSFFERLSSFMYRHAYMHDLKHDLMPRLNEISRNYLGENSPYLLAVQNDISMLFSSAHPIFHSVRSVYPNTVYVGSGLHLKEPEPLPDSAKILGIIPTASYSHQAPFQPLWRELAKRGHQVTVMTTDPEKNPSYPNLREIDMRYTYDIYKKHNVSSLLSDETKSYLEIAAGLAAALLESQEAQLSSPEVQGLIHSEDTEFDLVVVEAQLPGMLAFGWKFNCPIVAVTSMDCAMQYHDSMGNLVHPLVNPDNNLNVEDVRTMSFKERLISFMYTSVYKYFIYNKTFKRQYQSVKRYFGDDVPDLLEIQNNISMVFIGTHPIFHNIRPLNPNTITIVGTHIKQPNLLPRDLKTFLDEAKSGAIYFSLGSNVDAKILDKQFIRALMDAFSNLPYHVLLKFDSDLTDVPKNVMVRKWMPQQDILRHRNMKLFITQGGLQSLQEAITNDVPLIGIPFFGDQLSNVNKMVKKGYGIKLDKKKISRESLTKAIEEVMKNPKYREKAKEMGAIFRDEEIPSLERAVYWTEYVIRHKGAPHLRSPVVKMPAWKYYMLDVLGFLLLIIILVVIVCYALVKLLFWSIIKFCVNKKYKKKIN